MKFYNDQLNQISGYEAAELVSNNKTVKVDHNGSWLEFTNPVLLSSYIRDSGPTSQDASDAFGQLLDTETDTYINEERWIDEP